MNPRSSSFGLLLAASLAGSLPACAAAPAAAPTTPNQVAISAQLVTSGQPPAAALASLRQQGFDAVIYLAPLDVHGAVPDEAAIVERQGLRFVHIPIPFSGPTAQHFEAFVAAMAGLQDRKVLVHCQVNMRASSMVFLYRGIVKKEPLERAYESVAAIWSPDETWKTYIVRMLAQHELKFEPY